MGKQKAKKKNQCLNWKVLPDLLKQMKVNSDMKITTENNSEIFYYKNVKVECFHPLKVTFQPCLRRWAQFIAFNLNMEAALFLPLRIALRQC